MTRVRLLHDPLTGKIWGTKNDGATVETTSGGPSKPRLQSKVFPTPGDALQWAVKQEWTRLKKGYVLVDPAAEAGQPSMQRYIGGGYTGALMIAGRNGSVATNQHQDAGARGDATDMLVLVGEDGGVRHCWRPDKTDLAWFAISLTDQPGFLVRYDSGIHLWSADGTTPERISEAGRSPPAFLATSNGHVAWHTDGQVTVMRLADRKRAVQFPRKPTMVGGHSPQMTGALSPDAATLACCANPGEIEYVNVPQGNTVRCHQGDFSMITKMAWSADGRWLLALEQYGGWRLLCLNTETGESRTAWPDFKAMARADFALDDDGRRLAVLQRGQLAIYEFADMRELGRYSIDHLVRTARIAWTGEHAVSVRTDYGCLATYAV